ncbi:hypothetical protein [Clostridium sp. C2-6-12]|uniref:hypothetical protein n=1 Tax=Clostridium sp. C2-6-12 TaxID=2698832 RepID=UPI0013679E7D|nr:hypothetical protein [Clostridium sp. C2-6-12]
MEQIEEVNLSKMNITYFSEIICNQWDINSDILVDYIFSNISLGIANNKEMRKEVDKVYNSDPLKYYNAVIDSPCANHVVIKQGTFENEFYARKVLGILLLAESDNSIRNKIIKLFRKYYPVIFNTVRKFDKEKLKNKYLKMDIITRNMEAKLDAAIYLYLAVYLSPEKVDHGFVTSILSDIEDFEFRSLINQNVELELDRYKLQIQEIKSLIKREYGAISNYKDIITNRNIDISNSGSFFEDLFATNQIDINHIFLDNNFINIDKIILSYYRATKDKNPEKIVSSIISGIFIQMIINEYKATRNSYVENSNESLTYELKDIEHKVSFLKNENNELKTKLTELNDEIKNNEKNLTYEINSLNNLHKQELQKMENKIKELEKKLKEEENLRTEIEALREYELSIIEENHIEDLEINLYEYIQNKKIIIIGGDKEWRRRFRIKYPEIRTLNGFNENFDISILNNCDYIFFYTKYMNHSTFHKAMSYIKFNKCEFGYIGKTNINLVEKEIIDNIRKYNSQKN